MGAEHNGDRMELRPAGNLGGRDEHEGDWLTTGITSRLN